MTKDELKQKTDKAVEETRSALKLVYDSPNHGQQQKLLKDEAVAELFARYGVEV